MINNSIEYNRNYDYPPIDLLNEYSTDELFMNEDRVRGLGEALERTIREFKVDASVVNSRSTSLAITFTVRPGIGVSVKEFNKLKNDIELHLGSEIEINTVGEERGTIEIIVKNTQRPLIGLRSIIDTSDFWDDDSCMTIAAGVDIQGNPLYIDLSTAPHMLIAGSTGSGKSIYIDDILISLLYRAQPSELRLILMDPKRVELNPYNGLPHLLNPVISNAKESLDAFSWVEDEMIRRYDAFSQIGVKTIDEYNAKISGGSFIPRLLVIIDEYMDLMTDAPKEINMLIDRAARLGRAAGIHLILATQLPIAKVVTPQIKANIPCRTSFTVVDGRESKVILDKTGAERLLGSGDMIFSRTDNTGFVHGQAAYVSESELKSVVDFIKRHN